MIYWKQNISIKLKLRKTNYLIYIKKMEKVIQT